tara:strand:- start:308 stop:475 length:168 start_codon:yes stop_codon:yes gene_type:complete
MTDKKQKISCESTMCCKATAELKEEVEQDMEKSDASLKELLKNDDKEQKQDEHKV